MAIVANDRGWDALSGAVTAATFRGAPILAVAPGGASATSPKWTALLALAAEFDAPLVGCDDENDLPAVASGLQSMRKWWSSDAIAPAPVAVQSGATWVTEYPNFCGPVVVIPAASIDPTAALVWAWAAEQARSSAHHVLGVAMYAVSSAVPRLSPPLYVLNYLTWAQQLVDLARVWRDPPVPTLAQYEALAALEVARPGTSRYYHPSLVGWVQTTPP